MNHSNGNQGHLQPRQGLLKDYHVIDPKRRFFSDFRAVPEDELWIPKLAGWVPLYARGHGSLCLVFQTDGTSAYFGTSSKWIVDQVLQFYDINYSSMRQKYCKCTGRYQCIALPICQRDTFLFAVKGRHTNKPGSGRNDGAFGYLVNACIEDVNAIGPSHVRVSLVGDQQVYLHMGLASFQKQRFDGRHFRLCLTEHSFE